jgi:phosphoadenosine phosphosulfate reductase
MIEMTDIPLTLKVQEAKLLILDAYKTYPRIAIANSLGKDSMVLSHLAIELHIHEIVALSDTEFEHTYEFLNLVQHDKMEIWNFVNDGDCCCCERKVAVIKEAVADLDCLITGVRNTEGITRAEFQAVESQPGLTKINPLVNWTELDIWRYTAQYGVPVNPMYRFGYRSLGCKNCSSPEEWNESERAGRWRGDEREECGMHTENLK